MALNPFVPPPHDGIYNARGMFIDEQGVWEVEFSYERDCYILHNRETRETRYMSRREYMGSVLYPKDRSWRTPSPAKRDLHEIGRNRMIRIQDKHAIRRRMRLLGALWVLGWVWGGMAAIAITIVLLKLLTRQILG